MNRKPSTLADLFVAMDRQLADIEQQLNIEALRLEAGGVVTESTPRDDEPSTFAFMEEEGDE